jgi:hypothetical protein
MLFLGMSTMKNLVIKTAIITLASIVSIMAVTFGALCVFTPKTVAGIFENLGSKSASVFFYQKQYQKTNEIDDLIVVIDCAYLMEDLELQKEYLKELIAHDDFDSYCQQKDAENQAEISTREYYQGYYNAVVQKLND